MEVKKHKINNMELAEMFYPKYKTSIYITSDWCINSVDKINFINRFFMWLFLGWRFETHN